PHRRRVRVERQLHDHRLRRLGPERPRRAWGRHLRPSGAALLGDAALRHRAGRDPGLPNVLLAAPLMAPPPVVGARVLRVVFDASPPRVGVVLGTALGGVEEGEKAVAGDPSARRTAAALYDGPARALARRLGCRGPALTVSTACASGATSLGVAADLLRADAADLIVAG